MQITAETTDMLKRVYENAQMGERGTDLLIEKTEDKELLTVLKGYSEDYKEIKNEAAEMLRDAGEEPEDIDEMVKAMQWMGVQFNTLMDKSPSHIAEMLIQGSAMGIVKGEKNKNQNEQADHGAVRLQSRLIKLEERYLESMKSFL